MLEENLLKIAAIASQRLEGQGFTFAATSRISDFEGELANIGKPNNHPMLSERFHDFATDDAFGLLIKDKDGCVVAGMSARLISLGRDTLEDHWARAYSRYYTNNEGSPVVSRTAGAKEISGRLVYLGELFAAKNWRGGKICMQSVMYYAQALAALKWSPDWLYAFMRISDISRAPLYGFSRQYLGAHYWTSDVSSRTEQECLVAARYVELCDAAEFYLKNPAAFGRVKKR